MPPRACAMLPLARAPPECTRARATLARESFSTAPLASVPRNIRNVYSITSSRLSAPQDPPLARDARKRRETRPALRGARPLHAR
eukprot:7595528-Pyramimonas_sp.AAC.1